MESDIGIINCTQNMKKTNRRFIRWKKWTAGTALKSKYSSS